MREVVEAALAAQRQRDEALLERTRGSPPSVFVRSSRVMGVINLGSGSWLVALAREVEAPYLTPQDRVEFVTWRIVRHGGAYRAVEGTTCGGGRKTLLSPMFMRLTWWGLRLGHLLRNWLTIATCR